MTPENSIHIIGVAGNILDPHYTELIGSCALLVASHRMLPGIRACLPDYPEAKIISVVPLQRALVSIETALSQGDVAVLASGDPLFFGIGALLRRHFRNVRMQITPAVSAMQLAFASLGESWHDATFLSLHGRKPNRLADRILASDKICILTDQLNTPDAIARDLLQTLPPQEIHRCRCFVGEELGCEGERKMIGTLAEIADTQFADLNLMIILKEAGGSAPYPVFGLREDELQHSRGLITKDEIRAAVIHSLAIPRQGVFWDIGAGSGSVSVEVARLAGDLAVYAVERQDEQMRHISTNRERFSAWNLEPVKGEAPDILDTLPAPDRVFIGGSGGNLQRIIEFSAARLKPDGRIVVSAVLAQTCTDAPRFLHDQGLAVEIRKIEVSRSVYPMKETIRLNPISIITGRKTHEDDGMR